MRKYKAILFDLDGTLLPMDTDAFLNAYGMAMTKHFHAFQEKDLFNKIMISVNHVIESNEHKVNEEKFFECFKKYVSHDIHKYKTHFDSFYIAAFDETKKVVSQSKAMIEAVKVLKDKGYALIVATNPVFPLVANHKRIAWAGFDVQMFEYISSLEQNHYCKPNINFYKEVLKANNLKTSEVLMVGNDYEEDVVSSTIGIDNYIITNHMINRNILNIEPKYKGTYDAFLEFAKGLL